MVSATRRRYAFAPRVLAVLVLCALVFGSTFAALTYVVPFLQEVTGISAGLVSIYLLIYGVAAAVGSFGGGRFADWNAARTLVMGSVGAAVSLAALYLFGSNPYLVGLLLLALGVFSMGLGPSLQYRVVALAGPGSQLAQSLPASAINLGIAFGSFAGGIALGAFTTSAAVLTGLAIAVVAIPVALATSRLEPRNPTREEVTTMSDNSLTIEIVVPQSPRRSSTPSRTSADGGTKALRANPPLSETNSPSPTTSSTGADSASPKSPQPSGWCGWSSTAGWTSSRTTPNGPALR